MNDEFAVFILTNGRPDNVKTYTTLKKCGYTGKVFIIIDNLDKTQEKYKENFKDQVIVFDKENAAKKFDNGDNFNDMRAIIYARNECFEIAKSLGIKYFMELDDDYTDFQYRFDENGNPIYYKLIKNLDKIFNSVLNFYKSTNFSSVAIAQGGDFIGGVEGSYGKEIKLTRKCMNSFLCCTDRPFQFVGRVNEDVNTYTRMASTGMLFFTLNQVSLGQSQTQSNSGGMTEMYLDSGTYIKSFYSVMYHPSSVVVSVMNSVYPRLHHKIKWRDTVPLILHEKLRKTGE